MAEKHPHPPHDHLDRLSTEQLEVLLRADLADPDQSKEAVIFHILNVLEQREQKAPTGRLPDADQAWTEFKQFYDIPEGESQTLYPTDGPQGDSEDD
ncbi:hypothetical protein [Evtepia sp.]|uniref:hypothetical protein n=1 Tax=Evtepia sp. TaxID=2773933 RepID=UPI003F138D3F